MYREEFAEQAVILRVGRFQEANCWVKCLTPERGIITALAFGGLKSRKRFPGCIDLLNHVHFKFGLSRKGDYLTLLEGSLLNRFSNLSSNPLRLGMSVNCLKFLEAAHIGSPSATQVFDLLRRTLNILDSGKDLCNNLPLYFRARLSMLYGYAPDLGKCSFCGRNLVKEENVGFMLKAGQLACSRCLKKQVDLVEFIFSPQEFTFFRSVLCSPPDSWPLEKENRISLKKPLQAMDQFVQFHLGLVWLGNRFRQAA